MTTSATPAVPPRTPRRRCGRRLRRPWWPGAPGSGSSPRWPRPQRSAPPARLPSPCWPTGGPAGRSCCCGSAGPPWSWPSRGRWPCADAGPWSAATSASCCSSAWSPWPAARSPTSTRSGSCQVAYFNALGQLPVGVALLLEYSGTVLVVLWVWLRTRRAPSRTTLTGAVVALGGLALVLDVTGQAPPQLGGVVWGLVAAGGLATYYISASALPSGGDELPPVALAALGMGVGAVALAGVGALGLLPMRFATADVHVAGVALPWWAPVAELSIVAAAAAYLLGTFSVRRLGATVSSFVGLSEVLFAIVFAWLLRGELPRPVQLAGGALVVAGVVAVRLGEARSAR